MISHFDTAGGTVTVEVQCRPFGGEALDAFDAGDGEPFPLVLAPFTQAQVDACAIERWADE